MAPRVLHVITELETGGAETLLAQVVTGGDRDRFQHSVVSLTTLGAIGADLRARGVDVSVLGIHRQLPNPFRSFALRRLIGVTKPDVIKSWLYHANLAASVVKPRRIPVLWGIHSSSFGADFLGLRTRIVAKICAPLSKWSPRRVVYDSHRSAAVHHAIGYDAAKSVVIPNGFDTDIFKPDPAAGRTLRSELGIADDVPLVGMAARFHRAKDHRTFLEAASLLRREFPRIAFVLCGGTGITSGNHTLMKWIGDLGLGDAVHLLGRRENLPEFMASLDVGVCSSMTESFPLVVGELMAAGAPCVVTDVGDMQFVAGDAAIIVPSRDPRAISDGCAVLLRATPGERQKRGLLGRERIMARFSLSVTMAAYEQLFEDAVRH
ncbi:MAG TPA: glycosyltransferase [Thermoanaerobaculia bacterium]|jgi:glycosyltransferase involved in cell wall biosynthesis|nr:glycosyltransferase [Thermoanaerobaculia bacterium]